MSGFYGLRFISIVLRTIGWLCAIIGILYAVLPYIPESALEPIRQFDELDLITYALVDSQRSLIGGATAFILGIIIAGIGELFKVSIMIANDTRRRPVTTNESK